MKTQQITIFLLSISLICYGQKNNFNEWFDFNLKGNPKIIKEISLLSLSKYFEPDFSLYLNNTLKYNVFIDEYYFDTLGLISKEFHKTPVDTIGRWVDYSKIKLLQYKDSIILISYDKDGSEAWRERRFLDKNGYISCIIIDSDCPDTVKFKRDSNNRIIDKYRKWFCIDNGRENNTVYELNDNGDVKLERSIKHSKAFDSKSEKRYEYIYDKNLNWILQVAFLDNEIFSITQREIKY